MEPEASGNQDLCPSPLTAWEEEHIRAGCGILDAQAAGQTAWSPTLWPGPRTTWGQCLSGSATRRVVLGGLLLVAQWAENLRIYPECPYVRIPPGPDRPARRQAAGCLVLPRRLAAFRSRRDGSIWCAGSSRLPWPGAISWKRRPFRSRNLCTLGKPPLRQGVPRRWWRHGCHFKGEAALGFGS